MSKYYLLIFFISLLFYTEIIWAHTNDPPVITAVGNQPYCPGSSINIATSVTIVDPDDSGIEAMFVQISSGYIKDQDRLTLTGNHPNISHPFWNSTTAKLELRGVSGGEVLYEDFIAAILAIEFSTTSTIATGSRYFSITIGDANYLPSTGHFYEYVSDVGITWTEAKVAAENKSYFGLQGYLVTILSADEAQMSGEQAEGTGWIGGSDAATEGVWKWVTGPEAGTVFWNGLWTGSTPNFSFWNNQEPNNVGNEDYAHIKSDGIAGPAGSWNDLINTGDPNTGSFYHPQGYIVEYGGMLGDPILNISTSTSIHIPAITSITSNSRCGDGTILLEAIAGFGIINWYDAANGGNLVGTGSSFTTPNIITNTTYYVSATIAGCNNGLRTPVSATVYAIPTIDSTIADTICFNGTGSLQATSTSGSIINWYDVSTGGTSLATGNTFTTPNVSTTTIFYVDASTTTCTTTTRTPITLTVYSPIAPTGDSNQFYCEQNYATVSELVTTSGADIKWYDASMGGIMYTGTEILIDGQFYYASQNDGTCESFDRFEVEVVIYNMVSPTSILPIIACDNDTFGSDTDGIISFDLTEKTIELLNGQNPTDFTINYFTDANNLIQIPENGTPIPGNDITDYYNDPNLNDSNGEQTIYIQILNNLDFSCYTENTFNLLVNPLPTLNSPPYVLGQCDDDFDGFNSFNLTELNTDIITSINLETFSYFESEIDAISNTNAIANYLTYTNEIANVDTSIWVRIENENSCFRTAQVNLVVKPSAIPTTFLEIFYSCDDGIDTTDGIATFDFSSVTAQIEAIFPVNINVHYYRNESDATGEVNEITDPSSFENIDSPEIQEIWVRADSSLGNDCLGNGHHITLVVEQLPQFEVIPDAILCLNLPPIIVATYNAIDSYNYEWFNEQGIIIGNQTELQVSSAGTYSVVANYTTASGNICFSEPREITVIESIIATIDYDDVTITDDSDNNTVTINNENNNLGVGDYEFSLNDEFGPYQDEPFFDGVAPGIHIIYVRDKNNCGLAILEISIIGFPKFFTPNNDGYNDNWQVLGISQDFFPTSLIYIFNRFGKIIAKIDPLSTGWNGFYNGEMLPSDDYWFSVQLIDNNGINRNRKGSFSLIRR